jgi:hypothetical protein
MYLIGLIGSGIRAKRCRVLPGGGMAVFRAVDAFRLITGTLPQADECWHFSSAWPPAPGSGRRSTAMVECNNR